MAKKRWRCFHCDQVFRNETEAGIHFGADEAGTCACVLPHEQHLVDHIRDLEDQLAHYRAEDSNVLRSIYTLEADHRQALIREEQKGYDKGLRDARTCTCHPDDNPPVPCAEKYALSECRVASPTLSVPGECNPWGHKSRHCVYCGKVGPRVVVAGGYAHRRCIRKPAKRAVPRPRCRECADSDGFCPNEKGGPNCGFPKGHPLWRQEAFRPPPPSPRRNDR